MGHPIRWIRFHEHTRVHSDERRRRFGNLRRKDCHRLLSQMWPHVEALLPKYKMIAVYADRIEAME